MADFKISGRMKVEALQKQFKENFGGTLRVYSGNKFADPSATLASIRTGDAKGGMFSVSGNMRVGRFENEMKKRFGIRVQVANKNNTALSPNNISLSTSGLTVAAEKDSRQEEFDKDIYRAVYWQGRNGSPRIISLTLLMTFYGLTVPYLFLDKNVVWKVIIGIIVGIVTLSIWLFSYNLFGDDISSEKQEVRLLKLKYKNYEKSKSILQELEKETAKRKRANIIRWVISLIIASTIVGSIYMLNILKI